MKGNRLTKWNCSVFYFITILIKIHFTTATTCKGFAHSTRIGVIGEEFVDQHEMPATIAYVTGKVSKIDIDGDYIQSLITNPFNVSIGVPKILNGVKYYVDFFNTTFRMTIEKMSEVHNKFYFFELYTDSEKCTYKIKLTVVKAPSIPKIRVHKIDGMVLKAGMVLRATCLVEDGRLSSDIRWFLHKRELSNGIDDVRIEDVSVSRPGTTERSLAVKLRQDHDQTFLRCVADHISWKETGASYLISLEPDSDNERRFLESCNSSLKLSVKNKMVPIIGPASVALEKVGVEFCFSLANDRDAECSSASFMSSGAIIAILIIIKILFIFICIMIGRFINEYKKRMYSIDNIGVRKFTKDSDEVERILIDTPLKISEDIPPEKASSKLSVPLAIEDTRKSAETIAVKENAETISETVKKEKCDSTLPAKEVAEDVPPCDDEYMIMVRQNGGGYKNFQA